MSNTILDQTDSLQNKKILILMTGSIACYKVCALISQLKQAGAELKVVMSQAALEFIGPTTIEGLTGQPPITDMYKSGNVMDHIHLDRWADLILLAPATGNTINKMSSGIGDDLVTTLFLAHDFKKPFLIAPAMNSHMYLHPMTQKSILALKDIGLKILETASGVLACGEVGFGRLLEPDLLFAEVLNTLNQKKLGKKILITSGGTQEPIDDVRIIANKSTGKTAATIADAMITAGFDVTYLHAKSAKLPLGQCTLDSFESYSDLENKLQNQLKNNFNSVIHAAAVSDYSLAQKNIGKIDSSSNFVTLELKKNPKLIQIIKNLQPNTKLIGFKLTSTDDQSLIAQKVNSLFELAHCNFVVQNDWSTIKNNNHLFNIFSKNQKIENLKIDQLSDVLIEKLMEDSNDLVT